MVVTKSIHKYFIHFSHNRWCGLEWCQVFSVVVAVADTYQTHSRNNLQHREHILVATYSLQHVWNIVTTQIDLKFI